ncbi:MAG TPA: GntR family transcriptional regulator [Acidimicrobiales bacterium]|nr:GntR family transcriptional regulator [Acidimicrobiales bacterium]
MAEIVAGALRERIVSGDLPDGGSLPTLDALIDEFGVSAPSIRQALRILEHEGLITVRRGSVGGALVHRPSATAAAYMVGLVMQSDHVSVNDLARALGHLEPLCAELCARRPDRLRTVAPKLRRAHELSLDAVDAPAFEAQARRFHEELVKGCGNDSLALMVSTMERLWFVQEASWARRVTRSSESPTAEVRALGEQAHAIILDAIERGDAGAASAAAREHSSHPDSYGPRTRGAGRVQVTNLRPRPAVGGR